MAQAVSIRVNWEGIETVNTLEPLLQRPCFIEVALAANYFHAIYRQLYPDAPPGHVETLQEEGGGELLGKLAGVEGLQPLARLAGPVTRSRGVVKIMRPAILTIEIPAQ